MYELPDDLDLENPEFKNLCNLINYTNQSVFLTGKAGTGKSTFLKYICNTTKKKFIVLAPTGIAAVNVGGMTLHSFFKLPFKPLLKDDPEFLSGRIRQTLKYPKEKTKLIKSLDLIIIDEISMVRADIIDFIDKVLRIYNNERRLPFGGKQLLLVGDAFQLGPVVTPDMRDILRRYYRNFYFFNAAAFQELELVSIELVKCYRQKNKEFISVLDCVRMNNVSMKQLNELNSRYTPEYEPDDDSFVITLATRRDIVDITNETRLAALQSDEFVYQGTIKGDFPEQNLPTDKELCLKVGAQVIFVRNDVNRRWVNGTLGKVVELSEDAIIVAIEDGATYEVEKVQWENVKYTFNEKKNEIETTLLGTFAQYPIKPAWAITVHKSQGLTFNNVILDFGSEGAFTSGQTYVALSRCTSLQGIVLKNQIKPKDIFVDGEVINFSKNFNNQNIISKAFANAENQRNIEEAAKAIDSGDIASAVELFFKILDAGITKFEEPVRRLIRRKLTKLLPLDDRNEPAENESESSVLASFAKEFYELGINSLSLGGINYKPGNFSVIYPTPKDEIAVKSALANFDKCLKADPKNILALKAKADVYTMVKDFDACKEIIERLAKMGIKDWWTMLSISRIALLSQNLQGAIIAVKLAIKEYPKRPEPHDFAALIWETVGEPDLAEAHRTKAKKLRKGE